MRRLSLILLPFLAAFAMIFGLYNVYIAYRLVQRGVTIPAALILVFGLVGIGLAVAIWVARKRFGRSRGVPEGPPAGPSA